MGFPARGIEDLRGQRKIFVPEVIVILGFVRDWVFLCGVLR